MTENSAKTVGMIYRESGRKSIFGFLMEEGNSEPVNGILSIDDIKYEIVCNLYRENLKNKYGSGEHGFKFLIPEKFKDNQSHSIKLFSISGVLLSEISVVIPNGGKIISLRNLTGEIVNRVQHNLICGVLINNLDTKDIRTAVIKLLGNTAEFELTALANGNLNQEDSNLLEKYPENYNGHAFFVKISDNQLKQLGNEFRVNLFDQQSDSFVDSKFLNCGAIDTLYYKGSVVKPFDLEIDELLKILKQNDDSSDDIIVKYIDLCSFHAFELRKLLEKVLAVYNSNFLRLFVNYYNPQIDVLYSDVADSCTDHQIKLFCDFLLHNNDCVKGFFVINRHFPNFLTNDYITNVYRTSLMKGVYTLSLNLLEKFSFLTDNNESKLLQEKISIHKKQKAFHLIIKEINEYKQRTGDKKFDFEYIKQLLKLNRLDEAYTAIATKEKELRDSGKKDHRLHVRASEYFFIKGEYVKAYDEILKALSIRNNDKELLENQVKLLSVLGLKSDGLFAAKKLCKLYPSKLHEDMKESFLSDQTIELNNSCSLFVDLCNLDNLDEFVSQTYQLAEKFNRLTKFKVLCLNFVCNSEPTYKIPNLGIDCGFYRLESSNDLALLLSLCKDLNISWVGYLRPIKNMPEIIDSEISYFTSSGVREGCIRSEIIRLYRRTALYDYLEWLIHKNLLASIQDALEGFEEIFFTRNKHDNDGRSSVKKRILFITPIGISNFGGVEQFLCGMANCYEKNFIYDVHVIAFSDKFLSSCKYLDNTFFVPDKDVKKIKHYIYEAKPDIIWSLTDDDMAPYTEPLFYLKAQTVLGLHYYRSFLISANDGEFYCDNRNIIRKSFNQLLNRIDIVYANSIWTQRIILKYFNTVLPLLFSLPHKYTIQKTPIEKRKIVLTVNTEFKKGFDFVVEIASKLPDICFVSLSNQSNSDVARNYCQIKNVDNVKILPFQENVAELYSQSRIVLVPSFNFLETFSRVTVEAHHFGIPVIGADVGNIPYILENTGIVLPKDANVWASEIRKLFTDEEYYTKMSENAYINAKIRYNFNRQPQTLKRFNNYVKTRCLVALGSGIGNMILATPAIRKLSEYFNSPVDIVIHGVPKTSAMIFANDNHINAIYFETDLVKHRFYDYLFITRSFNKYYSYSDFNSNQIHRTRDLYEYIDMRGIHESELELRSLEHWLGISYYDDDIYKYTIKCNPFPPDTIKNRIGIHAGCKPGYWQKKQWPYFKELSAKLINSGYDVVSLGIPDEFVEGTIDGTSLDLWDTVNQILRCSFIISNESGIAHLSKALGKRGIVIIGPTYSSKHIPYHPSWKVMHSYTHCSPCFMDNDFETKDCDKSCLVSITVDDVYQSVVEALEVDL